MKLLLDTHVVLWWASYNPRLPGSTLKLLRDPANTLFISAVIGFEIATKVAIGKLTLQVSPGTLVGGVLAMSGAQELPLTLRHTYRVQHLPLVHRDPFDRLLIATALEDGLIILTADQDIRQYPVQTAW